MLCSQVSPGCFARILLDQGRNQVYYFHVFHDEDVYPPDGFTEQEWLQFLMDSMWGARAANYGGVKALAVGMEEPIAYTGEHPTIQKVWLTEEEMIELGVQPGDEVEGSTPMHRIVYYLDKSNSESDHGENILGGASDCANPYDPMCSSWTETIQGKYPPGNGSGLLIGTDSYIRIEGCQVDQWIEPHGFMATFSNSGQKGVSHNEENFRLYVPRIDCTTGADERHTYYAKTITNPWTGDPIWLVTSAYKWITLGEDAWDKIILRIWYTGGEGAYIYLHKVEVKHNDYIITLDTPLLQPNRLGARIFNRDLSQELAAFKQSKVGADQNWEWSGGNAVPVAVREAIKDYGQGPHAKYPVFPKDTQEPAPPPYTGDINVAYAWCSEFASWALRQENPSLHPDAPPIPVAKSSDKDIGVGGFFNWLNDDSWQQVPQQYRAEMRYFGDDLGISNGPTNQDWSNLETEIQPGDYVARNQFNIVKNDWNQHSMIFIGWVDQVNWTNMGPSEFNPNRKWNLFFEVSGNVDGSGIPGSRVRSKVRGICKEPDWVFFPDIGWKPIDPVDMPPGTGCYMKLWDTNELNLEKEGGFFGLIHF